MRLNLFGLLALLFTLLFKQQDKYFGNERVYILQVGQKHHKYAKTNTTGFGDSPWHVRRIVTRIWLTLKFYIFAGLFDIS